MIFCPSKSFTYTDNIQIELREFQVRFQEKEFIDRGTEFLVYKYLDKKSNEEVAVKSTSIDWIENDEYCEHNLNKIKNQLKIMEQFQNFNVGIIKLKNYCIEQTLDLTNDVHSKTIQVGQKFQNLDENCQNIMEIYVIQELGKQTLKENLQKRQKIANYFSSSDIIEISLDLAQCLTQFHKEKIYHNSINTSSIIQVRDSQYVFFKFPNSYCYGDNKLFQRQETRQYSIFSEGFEEFNNEDSIEEEQEKQINYEKDDVYQFGLVLLQMALLQPSSFLKNNQLEIYDTIQQLKKMDNYPVKLINLIIHMLDMSVLKRPTFEKICEYLQDMKSGAGDDFFNLFNYQNIRSNSLQFHSNRKRTGSLYSNDNQSSSVFSNDSNFKQNKSQIQMKSQHIINQQDEYN